MIFFTVQSRNSVEKFNYFPPGDEILTVVEKLLKDGSVDEGDWRYVLIERSPNYLFYEVHAPFVSKFFLARCVYTLNLDIETMELFDGRFLDDFLGKEILSVELGRGLAKLFMRSPDGVSFVANAERRIAEGYKMLQRLESNL